MFIICFSTFSFGFDELRSGLELKAVFLKAHLSLGEADVALPVLGVARLLLRPVAQIDLEIATQLWTR